VLDNEIVNIITYLFTQDDIDSCLQEDGLSLLKTYLNKNNRVK
jgi:hypothetical protein